MATTPFPMDPVLTAIAVMYRNTSLIADLVMPRVVVPREEFKYLNYDLGQGFTVPDTLAGRKSKLNQVEFKGTETTGQTKDYGLADVVPYSDITNAASAGLPNPEAQAVEWLTQLVQLDRESRVATATFNASNYASANKQTLSGSSQWSDASSTPVSDVLTALDACVMRPNIAVFGQAVWTKLRQHPDILTAVKSTGGEIANGTVSRQQVADLFELEQVLVGQAWINSAKKGQSTSLARCWGKYAAFIYRDSVAAQARGLTWGFTAQFGQRVAGRKEVDAGLRGGVEVRSGESVAEVVCANDLGYLFSAAVA